MTDSNTPSSWHGHRPVMSPNTTPDPNDPRLHGTYTGKRETLFPLAIKTALLTTFTLGIYRFWERTRIRRYIWSATAPGGDPFEYTGTGREKFLGFLIALVILAVGLGVVQLALFFVNLSVFSPSETVEGGIWQGVLFQLSFLIMLPLYFFAAYRSYRYRMSRTRWRGIRFGVRPGAWGYAWRHVVYLLLTIVSVGALWPLMTFRLEAYRADRTFFGDAQWHQGGQWTMLYPAMKHLGIACAIMIASMLLFFPAPFLAVLGFLLAWGWGGCGFVHYRVQSFAILTRHKVIGQGIRLGAAPRTGPVLSKLIGGGFIVLILGILVSAIFLGLLAATGAFEAFFDPEALASALSWQSQVVSIVGSLVSLQMYGVLVLIYIVQPIYAYVIEQMWVENPILLTSVRQRHADDMPDADGFADALDVGGAF